MRPIQGTEEIAEIESSKWDILQNSNKQSGLRLYYSRGSASSSSSASNMSKDMKYILVTGGVISGVGKGVIASSFGTLLNCCGIDVTSIKVDPYINIDAGTFSPLEHGECANKFRVKENSGTAT